MTHLPIILEAPTHQQLECVEGIAALIKSICEYVSPLNTEAEPERVAVIYSALFVAFRREGLLAPRNQARLEFQFRERHYLVDLHDHCTSNVEEEDSKGELVSSANTAIARCQLFLLKVQRACEACPRQFLSVCTDDTDLTKASAAAMSNADPVERIRCLLLEVDSKEKQVGRATEQVNTAYYDLGNAYITFVRRDAPEDVPNVCSRDFQQYAHAKLPNFGSSHSSIKAGFGTKKKLERARKFVMLVELLGPSILNATEIINVGQIDKVTFKMLITLQENLKSAIVELRMKIDQQASASKLLGKRRAPEP